MDRGRDLPVSLAGLMRERSVTGDIQPPVAVATLGEGKKMKRLLSGVLVAVVGIAGGARADTILNYNFTSPVDWVTNTSPYVPDGGTLFGSFTFDWTTNAVSNVNLTTTAATSGTPATATFTNMTNDYTGTYTGAAYTYAGVYYPTGTQYAEIYGYSGSQILYVDFTQLSTSAPFPGLLTGKHSSEDYNLRILASTVAASLPPAVPEPSGMAVLLSGIFGLWGIGMLRRGGIRLSVKGGASRFG